MWVADVPPQYNDTPAIYLAANASSAKQGKVAAPHKLGICRVVDRIKADVWPIYDADGYVGRYMSSNMHFIQNPDRSHRTDISLRIIRQPEHGKLEQRYPNATGNDQYEYQYIPNMEDGGQDHPQDEGQSYYYDGPSYNDNFIIEVSAGGITVEIHYTMSVGAFPSYIGSDGKKTYDPTRCPKPKGEIWKISLTHHGDEGGQR